MSKCENCGHEHDSSACPNCGHTGSKPFPVIELLVLIFVGGPALFLGGCGVYLLGASLIDTHAEGAGLALVFGSLSFLVGTAVFVPILRWFLRARRR
jgi:hypothetical protein